MLDLRSRVVLVVGAGPIATRKAEGLVGEGAQVRVVAPEISPDMAAFAASHPDAVTVAERRYEAGDLVGVRLVFTATNDLAVQQAVFDDGERLGVWVNAADDPDRCAFILPAVHRSGVVTVAVSTGGASPALAQYLRDRMRDALPADLDALVAELSEQRAAFKARGESTESIDWRPIIQELLDQSAGTLGTAGVRPAVEADRSDEA